LPVFPAFLSPLTVKMTIVNDDILSAAGAFGVEPGKKFRAELGAYANILYNKEELIKVTEGEPVAYPVQKSKAAC